MAGMMTDWCRVYTTTDRLQAEILHGMLESGGIPCSLVNRQDSTYIFLGEIELHVPCDLADRAMDQIRDALDPQTEN